MQTVGECLTREYRMVCHVLRGDFSKDFFEVNISSLQRKTSNYIFLYSYLSLHLFCERKIIFSIAGLSRYFV